MRDYKPGLAQPMVIGDWVVDPSTNRVSREGESAQLPPRVMEVLVYLAGRAGRVASRQEILDAVWCKEFAADNSVSQAIAELRGALGDDARRPKYIETIPKRGYRLMVPIGRKANGGQEGGGAVTVRRPLVPVVFLILLVAAVVVGWIFRGGGLERQSDDETSHGPRLVVLPFETIGPEGRSYFAAGLTEEITCRLALEPGVRVISRTTAANVARDGMTVEKIGRELEVEYVLEGSVRWEEDDTVGERVRITPQLIRVSDDSHVWTESYERAFLSAFAIQAEIGDKVLEQIGINLSRRTRDFDSSSGPPDPVAYDAFLRATAADNAETPDRYLTAISWYRRAVEVDPFYVPAWAGLARSCCLAFYFRSDRSEEIQAEARAAAARAADISPEGPSGYTAEGNVSYFLDRDYQAAGKSYRKAYELSLNPDLLVNIARVERRTGAWDTALTTLTSALERSPLSAAVMVEIGSTHLYLRNYDEALRWFDRVGQRNPESVMHRYMAAEAMLLRDGNAVAARHVLASMPAPKGDFWWSVLFDYEFFDRRFEQALECAGRVTEAAESSPPRGLLEALALARLDRPFRSAEAARKGVVAVEKRLERDPDDGEAHMWLALALALSGDKEEALAVATRAVNQTPMHEDALLGGDLAYLLAVVASVSDDVDLATETLQTLLSTPSLVSVESLRQNPMFDPLRGDKRFELMLEADRG